MDYNFTTTNQIIEELEALRSAENHAWIFENGKVNTDKIFTCDIVECLKNITDHEVEIDSDEFYNVYGMTHGFENMKCYNTYNYNGNSSEVIEFHIYDENFNFYVMMTFHRGGDVRCNYTDWVLYKFDSFEDLMDAFQSTYPLETDEWWARIDCTPWSELNNIYIMMKDSDDTYDMEEWTCEPAELIEAINKFVNTERQVEA